MQWISDADEDYQSSAETRGFRRVALNGSHFSRQKEQTTRELKGEHQTLGRLRQPHKRGPEGKLKSRQANDGPGWQRRVRGPQDHRGKGGGDGGGSVQGAC